MVPKEVMMVVDLQTWRGV